MSNVQYDDSVQEFGQPSPIEKPTTDYTRVLIQWGIVKDQKHAEYLLIGVCVAAIAIGFFAYRWSTGTQSTVPPVMINEALQTVRYLPHR